MQRFGGTPGNLVYTAAQTNDLGSGSLEPDVNWRPVGPQYWVDASVDPDAGTIGNNGKPIWSAQEAADNLVRPGYSWAENNYGELDDGVLNFGFWNLNDLMASYYVAADGSIAFNEAFNAQFPGGFTAFNAQQQAMAAANVKLWDDLIAVTFQQTNDVTEADITFGFTPMSPAAGAYAYYPSGDIDDQFYEDTYGFVEAGRLSGDVWANIQYQGSFTNQDPGDYGWWAITHELGHALGLAHGGDYNASDDNDGDGQPDPITYDGDAYFFQDSAQYTIMSYFGGDVTGAIWIDWSGGQGVYADPSTPMVHDVLAIQQLYGADMTTRTGNTTYGFNSNAGNVVYDFTQVEVPVLTIWDAGGTDTLDLSGYSTDSIIDLNPGAFSSAGHGLGAAAMQYYGLDNQQELDDFVATRGLGPDGRPIDNIAIAYGAWIENAVGGSGDDEMIGNELANILSGGLGNDVLIGGRGGDVLNGNSGTDTASYRNATAGVNAFLSITAANTGDAAGDSYSGIENLEGSDFNDVLGGDAAANVFLGGDGTDMVSYRNATGGVRVSLGNPAVNTGDAQGDSYQSIENLEGGNFSDVLSGNNGANDFFGGSGSDTVSYVDAGAGVVASLGNGTIGFGSGTTQTGEAAGDRYNSIEALVGSGFNDTLFAAAGGSSLFGIDGNDTLYGLGGADLLDGGAGQDTLIGDGGSDHMWGGGDNDTLRGDAGADYLYGDGGNDTLDGGAGMDVLDGGAGNDTYTGGGAGDFFVIRDLGGTDTITDFKRAQGDKIDLRDLNIDEWIGTQAFHNDAGEVRIRNVGAQWWLEGDTNGDGVADFSVAMGTVQLIQTDVLIG